MLKWNLGWVMGKNEPMENSEKRKFASLVFWWYSVSVNTRKTGDPNFGESVIQNFSIWLILKKWQPFFNFFIMADSDIPFPLTLGKLETQTLRGSVIGNFSIWSILKKWQPFFNFFIMADPDIPFPSTLGKPETQTLGGVSNRKFSVRSILKKWQPFFNFFIMANADIPFLLTLGKPETQTLWGSVIGNFSVQLILKKWQPFFNFFIMADADILHWEIQRNKCWFSFQTFRLVQFSPSTILGSVSTWMHGYA